MTKKKTQSKAAKFKSDMKKYNKGKSVKEKFFTLKLSKDDPRYKLMMADPKIRKLMKKGK
ncbi:hypothetical protein [uncultured Mediterranean phage uvMED]|nr:hypothetical protein [uncultured Mediterranean phage uvMED]BAR17741.1 hypothetical protein [uncultured Mediterranean phage uvMED]|tara:strand:- start:1626 stop:1805 length:180 start_codon:yes stop_codon:yes gene_type:complete